MGVGILTDVNSRSDSRISPDVVGVSNHSQFCELRLPVGDLHSVGSVALAPGRDMLLACPVDAGSLIPVSWGGSGCGFISTISSWLLPPHNFS